MSKGLSEVQSADPGAHHFPQEHGLDAIFFGRGERCQWVGGWGSGHQFFSFFRFFFCISKLQSGIPGVLVLVFKSEQDS